MTIPSRTYETTSDAWQKQIEERLDELESATAQDASFQVNRWHAMGRFNVLITKDFHVEVGSTGDEVSITDAGIIIDTRASTSAPRILRWKYRVNESLYNIASIYGAYGVAESESILRIAAERRAGYPQLNAQLSLSAFDVEHSAQAAGLDFYSNYSFPAATGEPAAIFSGGAVVLTWLTTDPSSLPDGSIYYNSSTGHFRILESGTWRNM